MTGRVAENGREKRSYVLLLALFLLPVIGLARSRKLPDREVVLGEPYAEWSIEYPGASGNPFDVEATALFTHRDSGATRRSLMFYAGDDTWKFRFTGVRTGTWSIKTQGPGDLGGWTGKVYVRPADEPRPGFMVGRGRAWVWAGTGRAFVPQFVMMNRPSSFLKNGQVDTAKIDRTVREFAVETGFTGFHFEGGGGKWFQPEVSKTKPSFKNPSPPTFEVLEAFIIRAYRAGAATHFWLYDSDGYGGRGGPKNLGGYRSDPAKRVLRQIAGRLGPIPGWSIGYGFDLHKWADAEELEWYRKFLSKRLGGWEHLIGARSDDQDHFPSHDKIRRQPMSKVYWTGDYAGHYDKRVPYRHYVRTYEAFDKPAFQEDRFRIRVKGQFESKDYTPDMTVRGLWHSTMAGGVANIWGNLLPHSDNDRGSQPYDNGAEGRIRGVRVRVNIKDAVKTYHRFWFEEGRFSADLIRANALTGNKPGAELLSHRNPTPISVALRGPKFRRFVFYAEDTDKVKMDLNDAKSRLPAVAIDTRRPYKEIDLDNLRPEKQTWKAPRRSDWAIAVGVFEE